MSGRGRGRGRRPGTGNRAQQNTVEEKPDNITNEIVEDKPKKTTRKKQFPVVAIITPDGIQGSLQAESKRPLIVHLPIQSKDILFNDTPILYNPLPPQEPEAYNTISDNPFSDIVEEIQTPDNNLKIDQSKTDSVTTIGQKNKGQGQEQDQQQGQSVIHDFYNLKATLLIQYKDSSELKKIPERSDSACFWCCHTFDWRPVILPIRDHGDYLQVHGNFCCPECAMSHLFDIRQDSHTRWEQLAILNRLYKDSCGGRIYPAPSRHILKLFGGNLDIQEYRALIRSQKVRVDIHLPPMVSLLSTMDTKPIDFYDTSLTKNVCETVKERLQKAEEVLKLRRTKPLKAWESTLDACMNLKIQHDEIKKPETNVLQLMSV